jgi:hypothetical protein
MGSTLKLVVNHYAPPGRKLGGSAGRGLRWSFCGGSEVVEGGLAMGGVERAGIYRMVVRRHDLPIALIVEGGLAMGGVERTWIYCVVVRRSSSHGSQLAG